jgi:hypothetical protein
VFASSTVELGKSQATAAGATLGPLGDAFLVTSVPGFSLPEFVTAQYPPSAVFPGQATATPDVDAGPIKGLTFHAVADGSPSARADATGGAGGMAGVLTVSGATASSTSHVSADGTVATTATSSVTGIVAGPLTISTLTSTASVEIPLHGAPRKSVDVEIAGALLGGVPISITQSGINLAGALPVPATSVATLDTALKSLSALGLTIQAVPITSSSATSVAGAALEIGYALPIDQLPNLPTDIGTNETILLGEVTATADVRLRQPLAPPPAVPSSPVPPAADVLASAPAPTVPLATPLPSPQPAPPIAPQLAAGPPPFSLPHRVRDVSATRFLHGYEIFLIWAVVAVIALLLSLRTRLTS